MHAYNRMEADQTDSIAVCATKEEWRAVVHRITQVSPLVEDDSDRLVYWLINMGVYE